jgi:uracil-DNA glycosylase
MSDTTEPIDIDALRRQLLAHAQHLRAAGVEWLPQAPAVRDPGNTEVGDGATADLFVIDQQPAAVALPLDERRVALAALAAEVKQCMRCPELCSTRTQTVFADGQPGVDLCFVGEAPGADEDRQGLPFVGEAGKLLNRIIAASGLKREEVYICNILKCRPPSNRTPLTSEAANCRGFLERQIELVAPKFIVALGGCAATNLLQTTLSVGKLRGRFHDFNGIPVMVTYHPAYLLPHKAPEKKREVWEDMKMLLAKMGRPIPR